MGKLIMLVLSLLAVGLLLRGYLKPAGGPAPTAVIKKVEDDAAKFEKQAVVRSQALQQRAQDE